jgi:hypothetical protein
MKKLILFSKAERRNLFDAPVSVKAGIRGGHTINPYVRVQKIASKSPMKIIVKSNGETIGTLTPKDFMRGINAPASMFLPDAVKQWNAYKESIGDPERVEISIKP